MAVAGAGRSAYRCEMRDGKLEVGAMQHRHSSAVYGAEDALTILLSGGVCWVDGSELSELRKLVKGERNG